MSTPTRWLPPERPERCHGNCTSAPGQASLLPRSHTILGSFSRALRGGLITTRAPLLDDGAHGQSSQERFVSEDVRSRSRCHQQSILRSQPREPSTARAVSVPLALHCMELAALEAICRKLTT